MATVATQLAYRPWRQINPEVTMTTEILPAVYSSWTTEMVAAMPRVEGERYEIIGGALHVTTQPHMRHQGAIFRLGRFMSNWNDQAGVLIPAPGVIYDDDNAVAPDLVWMTRARYAQIAGRDGKLHGSPELVVEMLSPGKANEERDREFKLVLFDRQGVDEYWICDWRAQTIDIYRRDTEGLRLAQSLDAAMQLTSPLLPGFSVLVETIFQL